MKKNILYISLTLLIIHLLNVNSFANAPYDLFSCRPCQERLSPEQLNKANAILKQAKPKIQELRLLLREKRQELKNLHYNINTDPEAMVQLGMELQAQRKAIMNELQLVNQRLQKEVGINVRIILPPGRGCSALQKTDNCPIYIHHAEKKH